jgi:hypothetical protein
MLVHIVLLSFVFQAQAADVSRARTVRGVVGAEREQALLQTYDRQLSGSLADSKVGGVTPVTRVVNLLKEMAKTLNKEQEEDEALYDKLACWCNNNEYEKKGSSDAATAKIADLEATIEMLTARSKELKTKIKELESEVAADKAALATATALREKQLKEFHAMELDNIAALENLKAAIAVLSRHHGAAFPQMALTEDSGSPGFLQGWSAEEIQSVKLALKSAKSFMQSRQSYMPSYSAQSGEIFGVLKQLQEEMKGALSEAQKTEAARAAAFGELRSAKTSQIESGEKMAETKEDQLAKTDMDLAEAKEDLGQTQASLAEDQKFLANLETTCKEADANFAKRKASRLAEIEAVSQTIEILNADEAKDAMDTTFKFIQTVSEDRQSSADKQRRNEAAAVLRKSAAKTHSPELAMLATTVELDAFTKVKAMIDKMITTLQGQQADEVKKNDWCKAEIQENEMSTMKAKDQKADQEATIGQLEATIKTLSEEIEKAHLDISNLQLSLQRASENRKQENLDFQKVVADQMVTAEILSKALDKLATFYDEAAFAQTHAGKKQTPPVPQMEYSKSKGATGVMSMIEKLIYDTKEITAESKKSESEAQAAYEALVADTNDSVSDLTKEITSKTQAKAKAKKDLAMTQEDLADTVAEIEDLGKYNADMHGECDYLLKNFNIRQEGRAQEVEALKQAKSILSGASLS